MPDIGVGNEVNYTGRRMFFETKGVNLESTSGEFYGSAKH